VKAASIRQLHQSSLRTIDMGLAHSLPSVYALPQVSTSRRVTVRDPRCRQHCPRSKWESNTRRRRTGEDIPELASFWLISPSGIFRSRVIMMTDALCRGLTRTYRPLGSASLRYPRFDGFLEITIFQDR